MHVGAVAAKDPVQTLTVADLMAGDELDVLLAPWLLATSRDPRATRPERD